MMESGERLINIDKGLRIYRHCGLGAHERFAKYVERRR